MTYFGNSEIGFDRATSQMRRRLQQRFGDGGKGFVVGVPGWRYQRHQDLHWTRGGKWALNTVLAGARPDGRYGYGGVMAANVGKAWIEYGTVDQEESLAHEYHPFPAGTRLSRFILFFQSYPGGGTLEVRSDDKWLEEEFETSTLSPRDEVLAWSLPDGPHKIRLSAGRRPVRVYGAAMERDKGIVLDAVMVVGAWSDTFHNYDDEHMARQVRLRRPDLVMFQWGARELKKYAEYSPRQAWMFRRDYVKSVRKALSGVPETPCLIVSTKDMGIRERNLIVSRKSVKSLVYATRQAADVTGCAYFDLYNALGGEGTIRDWFQASPRKIAPDLGHLMRPGAIEVGDTITEALMKGYEAWRKRQGGDQPPAG